MNVVREAVSGIYLDAENFGELLLPNKEVLPKRESKEICEVFLYYDAKENVVATTLKPYGVVGKFACLKVIEVAEIGAFLDWGLSKDLFVPMGEQQEMMEEGESHIVYIYKDLKRNRLAASSKLKSFLNKESTSFTENQKVDLLIAHETELGINAIINDSHWGLLYYDEVFQDLEYGQSVEGYIKKIRTDHKIDLSLEFQGYAKMDDLEEKILSHLNGNGGKTTITDKSLPGRNL